MLLFMFVLLAKMLLFVFALLAKILLFLFVKGECPGRGAGVEPSPRRGPSLTWSASLSGTWMRLSSSFTLCSRDHMLRDTPR